MSESDGCDINCTCVQCKGKKRVSRIEETGSSDSDSPVSKSIKRKKIPKVLSDGQGSSDAESFEILKRKKRKHTPRVMSDDEGSSSSGPKPRSTNLRRNTSENTRATTYVQPSRNPLATGRWKISAGRVVSETEESSSSSSGSDSFEEEDEADSKGAVKQEDDDGGSDSWDGDEESDGSLSGWESNWTSEDDVTAKPAVKSTAVSSRMTVVVSDSDSSDGQSEKCPICLRNFTLQEVGTPESCDHSFCAVCLQEWAKNMNTCPVDRQPFTLILVRSCLEGKIVRREPVESREHRDDADEIQEDPTPCEVCGRCDREDRLLLCDECDSGYHLDCLDPPLETVPVEEWFCPECVIANATQIADEAPIGDRELFDLIDDAHATIGTSPLRRRVNRLLPRTRQSERVRTTIIRQEIERRVAQGAARPSTSSGIDLDSVSRLSLFFGPRRPSTVTKKKKAVMSRRRKKFKRRTKKKTKKSTKTRTKTTTTKLKVSITKKKSTSSTTKRKTTKKTKKKRTQRKTVRWCKARRCRVARSSVPHSVKGRLAEQLGMRAPKIPGQMLPDVRARNTPSNINLQRSLAGIPTLHIFGRPDQIDFFTSGSDLEDSVATGGEAVGTVAARPRTSAARNARNLVRRKLLSQSAIRSHSAIGQPSSGSPCDLISSILDSQTMWHSKKAVVSINRDRSFTVKGDVKTKPATSPGSSGSVDPILRTDNGLSGISDDSPVNVNHAPVTATQVPLYPGQDGNSRPPPSGGFTNFGNPRYASGSGSYGSYRGARTFVPFGNVPGFDNRDSRAGYSDFLHGGPPTSYRGGSPVRFRMPFRNAQKRPPFPQKDSNDPQPEDSKKDESEDEEVDIYSDIEVAGVVGDPVEDAEPRGRLLPPPLPPAMLMGLGEHAVSDDDSDEDLVIDDKVPQHSTPPNSEQVPDSEKYDPAEPSYDSDTGDEPFNESLIPLPPDAPTTGYSVSQFATNSSNSNSYLHSPVYDDSNSHPDTVVSQAVKEVLKVHLEASSSAADERCTSSLDGQEDEECPNFSIYSAASMDIARSSDAEPRLTPEETIDMSGVNEEKLENISPEMEDEKEFQTDSGTPDKEDISNRDCATPDLKDENSNGEVIHSSSEGKHGGDSTVEEKVIKNKDDPSEDTEPRKHDSDLPFEDKDKDEENVEDLPVIKDGEEGAKKDDRSDLVAEIFGSDEESLVGGATSPVSAASSSHTPTHPPTHPPTGLEGLETEAISETDEVIHFDELSDTSFATVEEDGEIPSKRKKKKGRKSPGGVAKSGDSPAREPIDYEEGEIVDLPKKDKKKESEMTETLVKVSDENVDITKKPLKSSEEDKKKRKKKEREKTMEKSRGSKDRSVLGSKENKEKAVEKSSRDDPNIAWKKPSKAKDRNYRDGKGKIESTITKGKDGGRKRNVSKEKDEESAFRKEKEKDRKKKDKRQDMERYDVRKIVTDKKRSKRRDEFGRDLLRDRSYTRTRSLSYNRTRGRSRSISKPRSNRGRRTPAKTRRRTRSRSRGRSRSRSRLRSRTRSRSVNRNKVRPRSRVKPKKSRSRERLKRFSPERFRNRKKSRSRSRTRSPNRSRLRSRSRTPLRLRNRKDLRENVPVQKLRYNRRSVSPSWTPSWSQSGSFTGSSYSRSGSRSLTPRKHFRSYSRSFSRSWTPEQRIFGVSKKPVGISKAAKKLTVTVPNTKDMQKKKDKKKKELKRKDGQTVDKRKKRRGKSPAPSKEVFTSGDNILVSVNFNKSNKASLKEASNSMLTKDAKRKTADDGIKNPAKKLKKGLREKLPPQGVKARLGERKRKIAGPRLSRIAAAAKKKPMAIIDLDQSPFHEQTPSPRDLIVLSDSEDEIMEKSGEEVSRRARENSASPKGSSKTGTNTATNVSESQSPIMNNIGSYLVTSTGPKTPPEPQVKFSIAPKQTLRSIMNPLQEEDEDLGDEVIMDNIDRRIEEELNRNVAESMHKGPNTPPEPRGPSTPGSSPTSPDAYDPFDPTKSRSPSPVRPGTSLAPTVDLVRERDSPAPSDREEANKAPEIRAKTPVDEAKEGTKSPERATVDSTTKSPGTILESPVHTPTEPPTQSQDSEGSDKTKQTPIVSSVAEPSSKSPSSNSTPVTSQASKLLVKPVTASQGPTMGSTPPVSSPVFPALTSANIATMLRAPPPSTLPTARNVFAQPSPMSVAQLVGHHHLQHQFLSSPAVVQRLPSIIERPVLQKILPQKPVPVRQSPQKNTSSRTLNGEQMLKAALDKSTDVVDMELESPYSPASSEANDLFEPPVDLTKPHQRSTPTKKHTGATHKSPAKLGDKFDNIFGESPLRGKRPPGRPAPTKHVMKNNNKPKVGGKHDKGGKNKKEAGIKLDEEKLQILAELPSSAVELQVKDKWLKKLNRQERVVEEVKLSLKPHYAKKHVTKEEYKDILRRSVPKICHNRSGEINPLKIASLVEAYVKRCRYKKKTTGAAATKPKLKTTMWS